MHTHAEALDLIIDVTRGMKGSAHLWPILVGHTGTGKTARVNSLAEKLGLPVYRLLLGTLLPEDVLGLPRVDGRTPVTRWTLPEWAAHAAEKPCLIFLDELDKATESLSAVLTLLAEKRVRDTVLHKDTIIVGAMQPVDQRAWLGDERTKAISSRAVFLPVPYDWSWLGNHIGMDLSFLPKPDMPQLPILPSPSPRQIEWAATAVRRWNGVLQDHEIIDILTGVLPQAFADELLNAFRKTIILTSRDLVDVLLKEPERMAELTVHQIISLVPDIWLHGTPELYASALKRVWLHGHKEDAEAFLKTQYERLAEIAQKRGTVEVFGSATEEHVAETISKAIAEIAEDWTRQNEQAKTRR